MSWTQLPGGQLESEVSVSSPWKSLSGRSSLHLSSPQVFEETVEFLRGGELTPGMQPCPVSDLGSG